MEIINKRVNKTIRTQKTSKMNFVDGILAISYYGFNCAIIFLYGLLVTNTDIYSRGKQFFSNSKMYDFIFDIPISLIEIIPIIVILFFRKQKYKSIGITRAKLFKSIIEGFLFSLPFIIVSIINATINNFRINNVEHLVWGLLYYLICIAFVEEIIFRGFIQTRMRGIIKNKWICIIVVGLMFGAIHIPYQFIISNMSILQFIKKDAIHLLFTVIMHLYLVYIFSRSKNIIAPTITHGIANFAFLSLFIS